MTGWTANDTISGYHYYQSNTGSSQTALLNFQGAAVWVWGFCGPRGQFLGTGYGSVSVDGDISARFTPCREPSPMTFTRGLYQDDFQPR